MFNRSGAVLALTMLAACGSAAAPDDGRAQVAARAAKPLDIAGIAIGMPGSAVESILKRDGWTMTTDAGDTWDQAVDIEVYRQRHGGIGLSSTI